MYDPKEAVWFVKMVLHKASVKQLHVAGNQGPLCCANRSCEDPAVSQDSTALSPQEPEVAGITVQPMGGAAAQAQTLCCP